MAALAAKLRARGEWIDGACRAEQVQQETQDEDDALLLDGWEFHDGGRVGCGLRASELQND